jgi:DNA replication protein DnaC
VVERTTEGAQPLAAAESARPGPSRGEPKMVWAVPCECTAVNRGERVFVRARIPERYRHCDFESFEIGSNDSSIPNEKLRDARFKVQEFVKHFTPATPDGEPNEGMLLMGPCGVGKTHLAVAALKQLVSKGYVGLFYDYRELLKEIQDSYNPESGSTEMGVLEPVLKADILLLDDVGGGKSSDWVRETVGHVLNSRYNERRATIMTTNYLDRDLADRVHAHSPSRIALPSGETVRATEQDTLSDRVGARIRSRLYEMCRTIEIVAPDYRKEFQKMPRHA